MPSHPSSPDDVPHRLLPDGGSVPVSLKGAAAAVAAATDPAAQAALLESLAHASTLPRAAAAASGQPLCQRCEVLPGSLDGAGTLELSLPHTHTLGKVLAWLVRTRRPHDRRGGLVGVRVHPGHLAGVLAGLTDLLSAAEVRDTRVVFHPAGRPPQAADYFGVADLPAFAARVGADWLVALIRDDRLTSHFHPIVHADGRGVFGYECLLRAEANGRAVSPGEMFDVARRADLLFQLDLAARRAALRAAAGHQVREKVFVNFSPNAIYDAEHCLDNTVRQVDALGLSPGQVVFEVVEGDRLPDPEFLKGIVGYYRRHGFEVAVDDLGAGYASLQLLLDLRPDYVKLDMSLTRGVHADAGKATLAKKLLEAARDLGLRTVAEGVEEKAEWDWLRGHGADYVQGFYFARPAATPPVPQGI